MDHTPYTTIPESRHRIGGIGIKHVSNEIAEILDVPIPRHPTRRFPEKSCRKRLFVFPPLYMVMYKPESEKSSRLQSWWYAARHITAIAASLMLACGR